MKRSLSFSLVSLFVATLFITSASAQWTLQTSPVATATFETVKAVNDNIVWAGGKNGVVVKTVDGGKTWVQKTLVDSVGTTRVNSIEAFDSLTAWVGCISTGSAGVTIYKTSDGGKTWVKQYSDPAVSFTDGFRMYDANNGILVGDPTTYWYILKTTNGGTTWTRVDSSKTATDTIAETEVSVTGGLEINGNNAWFCTYNNGNYSARVYRSTDKGASWAVSAQLTGIDVLYAISFKDSLNGLATSSDGNVVKSTDGGKTWTIIKKITTLGLRGLRYMPGTNTALAVGASGVSFLTQDDGATWSTITPLNTNTLRGLSVSSSRSVAWAVGDAGAILKWSGSTLPVELTSFKAAKAGSSVNLSWTTATETNNRGFEVERKLINDKENSFVVIAFKAGAGTSSEVRNYNFTDDIANLAGTAVAYRIKQVDFDGTSSYSSQVLVDLTTPVKFNLSQNYPNPFNPTTTINYSLPSDSKVSVKVYDVLGKEVATLVNETKSAGNYQVNFDASKLASGVYIYKIQAGNFIATKKLTLMK
jgi:photosystem II stability/assembly factor-like uncharacterized protein